MGMAMLGQEVIFIDTSILCNIVPVPGFNQDQEAVRAEMKELIEKKAKFILPITTVIETGNHIAQLAGGNDRRESAERFSEILRLVVEHKAPWSLVDVEWREDFLSDLLEGADTEESLVDLAVRKVGLGDLCILTERMRYERRTQLRATIWTHDKALAAHNPGR
jgi:hypothetical protein